jgi:ABC-type multidrug transport system permease subunit
MNKFYLAAIITALGGILITANARSSMSHNDRIIGLGVVMIVLTIFFTVVGCVLSIFSKTRPLAKGVFLGMGIHLVIGFAICTV